MRKLRAVCINIFLIEREKKIKEKQSFLGQFFDYREKKLILSLFLINLKNQVEGKKLIESSVEKIEKNYFISDKA